MLKLGLTSVTFRSKSAEEIVEYCKTCGLSAIEWGSDVHVKPGDLKQAETVRKITENSGITVCSYGSYYRLGETGRDKFEEYAKTAQALNAPIIRIWGGSKSHRDLSKREYKALIDEVKAICKIAEKYNLTVAFEYHNDSLTDTKDAAIRAISDAGAENLGMYYQYDPWISREENYETLKAFLPYLKMVHVFNVDEDINRYSIRERNGREFWGRIIKILKQSNADVCMLFEFLRNEAFDELKGETEIMKNLLTMQEVKSVGNK